MPPREAHERYVDEVPYEESFEPAQHALVRVAVKWLRLLTPEERLRVGGLLVEFEGDPREPLVEGAPAPVRVTLLRRGGVPPPTPGEGC